MSAHSVLTGLELHPPFHYNQDANPGAVGAGKWWASDALLQIAKRKADNSGWLLFGAGGSSVPGMTVLQSGSTWDDVLAAYAAATAGDTIMLPNETVNPSSVLVIDKDITILGHPGGLSNLTAISNLEYSGSGMTMAVFGGVHVRLSGFTIEHNRSLVTRINGISCGYGLASLEIDHMTFTNITADCVTVFDDPPGQGRNHKISMHDCVVNEWYESVFNLHQGDADEIEVYGNVCATSAPNPNGAVSRPYGLTCSMEFTGGIITHLTFANNVLDASGVVNRGDMNNSLGVAISRSDDAGTYLYRDVVVKGNHIVGFYYGIYIAGINGDGTSPGNVVVMNNLVESCDSSPIYFDADGFGGNPQGHPDDVIAFIGNNTDVTIGPNATGAGTVIDEKNNLNAGAPSAVSSFTETWTHADSTTLTADQVWHRVQNAATGIGGGIVSNTLQMPAGKYVYARCETPLTSVDHYAEADFKVSEVANVNGSGVGVRWNDLYMNGYWAFLNFGANEVTLWRVLSSMFFQIGTSQSHTLNANTYYRLRLSVTGSLLTVSIDGTPVTGLNGISAATPAIADGVRCGLLLNKGTTGTATSDNFAAAVN